MVYQIILYFVQILINEEYYYIIGELNPKSDTYKNCKTEDECVRKRITEELNPNKILPKELDNILLSSTIKNYNYITITYNKPTQADNQIHNWMTDNGYNRCRSENNSQTEFFKISGSWSYALKVFQKAVLECFNHKCQKIIFEPRKNQERFIEKFIKFYKNENIIVKTFLLGAICRFGKSAATLYVCYKLGLKNILILSGKCDTKNSWCDDYNKFTFTDNYTFIEKEDFIENKFTFINNVNYIGWFSFQSAGKKYDDTESYELSQNEIKEEPWQKIIIKYKWDIIILDECHFATETERTKKLINKILINNPNCIKMDISATPFTKIEKKEYSFDNSFIYFFNDEIEDYKKGFLKNSNTNENEFVPFQIKHINLLTCAKNGGLEELNKKSGKYTENIIKQFITNLNNEKWSWLAFFNQFSSDEFSFIIKNLFKNFFDKTGKTFMIYVNRVEHGKILENILKYCFHDERIIYNFCGNNKNLLKEFNTYLYQAIYENNKPVIGISCGKYLTGVTEKYLENIIFMGPIGTAEKYIQYGCRAKNWFLNRKNPCTIYDLNPESFIYTDMFKNICQIISTYKNISLEDTIKEWEDCCNIFELTDMCNFQQIYNFTEILQNSIYLENNGDMTLSEFNTNIFNDYNFLINFNFLKDKKFINKKIIEVGTNGGISKAKELTHPIINKSSKNIQKNLEEEMEQLLIKIKEEIQYIPGFMKYNDIIDINDLFSIKYINQYKYWRDNNFSLKDLEKIKNYLINTNKETYWNSIKKNIFIKIKSLSNDRSTWKYDAVKPEWFIYNKSNILNKMCQNTIFLINKLYIFLNFNNDNIKYLKKDKQCNFKNVSIAIACSKKQAKQIKYNLNLKNENFDYIIICKESILKNNKKLKKYIEKFFKKIKNNFGINFMNFDKIIMNPPYEKNLHLKILENVLKYLKENGECINLSPIRWLQDFNVKNKKNCDYNKFQNTIRSHIKDIIVINKNKAQFYFPDTVMGADLGIYYLTNKIENYNFSLLLNNICKKIKQKCKKFPIFEANKKDGYRVRIPDISCNGGSGNRKPTLGSFGNCILFFNGLKDNKPWYEFYGKNQHSKTTDTITNSIKFNSEKEGLNFCNTYNNLYLCKYFTHITKVDVNVTPDIVLWLEDLENPRTHLIGYNSEWNDNDLYVLFNITKDEQIEIENLINLYKNEIKLNK